MVGRKPLLSAMPSQSAVRFFISHPNAYIALSGHHEEMQVLPNRLTPAERIMQVKSNTTAIYDGEMLPDRHMILTRLAKSR
jgi:hypothetical protein